MSGDHVSKSFPCGWCLLDPVRKGKVCCDTHNLVVCAGCRGTDRYINSHRLEKPMKVYLVIEVEPENRDELTDTINETLNELARNDVINDDYDAAWTWMDGPPPVTTR